MVGSPSDAGARPARRRAPAILLLGLLCGAAACKKEPAAATFATFQQRGCTSCHAGGAGEAADTCTGCHVQRGIRARGGRDPHEAHALYGTAPSLAMLADLTPKKFTDDGLKRFLAAPETRMSRSASMFPLHGEDAADVAGLLAEPPEALAWLFGPASPPEDPALAESGQALYESLGCRSCHEEAKVGPRLRLGYPLLSREFFRAKLSDPARAAWPGERGAAMPSFPSLPAHDIDALYAYISSTRDTPPPPQRPAARAAAVMLDSQLYEAVDRALLHGSCRHCHSATPSAREEMRAMYPSFDSRFVVDRAGEALGFGTTDPSLLSPGPGCGESPLVRRLRARHEEWAGERSEVRGMPLTLAPLDPDTIRVIDVWTKRGCPSPEGPLCRKCTDAGASR